MILSTPENLGQAPLWENHIIAQAVQASLGLIPRNALAVGISVSGPVTEFFFQMSALTDDDEKDMNDIVDEFVMLVGDGVRAGKRHEVRTSRVISPFDGVCWIFLARN